MQRQHELKLAELEHNNQLMRDFMKYVGEDFDSQLLMVAVAGTGIAALLAAYQSYVAEQTAKQQELDREAGAEPPKEKVDIMPAWMWILSPGGALIAQQLEVGSGGLVLTEDLKQQLKQASGPWGLVGGAMAGATTVAGLAWALLFTRAIMGSEGMGGIMSKGAGALGAVGL